MENTWPLAYSGLPGLLSSISLICFASGIFLALLGVDIYFVLVMGIGFVCAFLSIGRRIKISNNHVVLEYGFPVTVIRITINDIVDVFNINELRRGKLIRYFKVPIIPFILIIVLPPTYILVKGVYPSPIYIPLILLPVLVGIVLSLYFMFTAPSYRKLIERLGIAVGTSIGLLSFIIGATYREVYGSSILSNPHAITMTIAGMLLLAVGTFIIVMLTGKRPIIVLEGSRKKFYAIGALNEEVASEFIKTILIKVMKSNETTT